MRSRSAAGSEEGGNVPGDLDTVSPAWLCEGLLVILNCIP